MEPVLIGSFLGNSLDIIQKLKDEKIISHEGLIIYHAENEIEYRIDLNIGDLKSRFTAFKNFFKSTTLRKITFEAIEVSGVGMQNENLVEMGLIELNGNQLTIDFPRILREVKSNLVIILFRTRFSNILKDQLVHRQISKVNSIKDGKLISNFVVVLDYANLWYSSFSSFSVRNIIFTLNHNLPKDEILNAMTEELKMKLDKADKLALQKENARKFLAEFQRIILELQDQEFLSRLEGLIEINPHTNGRIDNVIPSLKVFEYTNSKLTVTIPDHYIITISANIEDRETAINATLTFDLNGYRELLKEKFKKFKDQTRKIKF